MASRLRTALRLGRHSFRSVCRRPACRNRGHPRTRWPTLRGGWESPVLRGVADHPQFHRSREPARQNGGDGAARNSAEDVCPGWVRRAFCRWRCNSMPTSRCCLTLRRDRFRPSPKVTSTVIEIRPLGKTRVPLESVNGFFDIVKAGFSQPRKQLRNSLANGLGAPSASLTPLWERANIDPVRRPATLSLDEWAGLYEAGRGMGIGKTEIS